MAQLRTCESEEEFMNAWKAGLLVGSNGDSVLSYETHCEWYTSPNNRDTVYQANKHHVFILVEDGED